MDTSVKWYHSGMPGIGSIVQDDSATNTSFLSVLDNVLFSGFNSRAAVSCSVSNGVATIEFGSAHGFSPFSVVEVSGASNPAINGEKRVLSTPTSSSLTVLATGASDGPVSGSISVKYAPAGWDRVFPITSNTIAFRTNPQSPRASFAYQFEATGSTAQHRFRIFQNLTGVNSGQLLADTGNFSLSRQFEYGRHTYPFIIVASNETMYIFFAGTNASPRHSPPTINNGIVTMFGNGAPLSSSDVWFGCMSWINQPPAATPANRGGNLEFCGAPSGGFFWAGRSYTGGVAGVGLTHVMESFYSGTAGASGGSGVGAVPAYPNGPDTSLILTRKAIFEGSHLRGFAPGLYMTPQNCAQQFSQMQIVDGQGALAGRKLLAVRCGSGSDISPAPGVVFFDITGPWSYTP